MQLTPPIEPAQLEQCVALFRLSRLVHAAATLRIAGHLRDGPRDAASLAQATATHAGALATLLDALAAWGVFARDDEGRYALTPVSERLVPGATGAVNLPLLLGWQGSGAAYDAFGDILHTVRTGESAFRRHHEGGFHGYLAAHPEEARLYDAAMESTHEAFEHGAGVVDFGQFECVVDVGGGQGEFLRTILARHPRVRGLCFDVPAVVAAAPRSEDGRLTFAGGDALEAVPAGGDAYLTSTVLRCFDDEACARILRNIRRVIPAHGKLLAFEMVMPADRRDPAFAMADMTARVIYGGRDRTEAEFRALLEVGGFALARTIATGRPVQVLEAVPR